MPLGFFVAELNELLAYDSEYLISTQASIVLSGTAQ